LPPLREPSSLEIIVSAPSFDHDVLLRLIPAAAIGEVRVITPIRMGLSGAGVYAVTSARGEYVLRVQGDGVDDDFWSQHIRILRRAAEHGVAPPVVHIDEDERAVISVRVLGVPLGAALADPSQRDRAIADVVARLRALHEIDPTGVAERDGLRFARGVWEQQRRRAGFPQWAADLGSAFDNIGAVLARDSRRVVSHNDVNPGNVLWDGTRTWLVDWEVAGLWHPYYDLAAFTTFLAMEAERGYALLAIQEGSPVDTVARETFAAMRQLVALAVGSLFLSMVPELSSITAPTRAEAPTQDECRLAMRRGELDLQTAAGRARYGLAFLRVATENEARRVE
jgi:aminoglycoside phosphotransferase (APT) family kinase protein